MTDSATELAAAEAALAEDNAKASPLDKAFREMQIRQIRNREGLVQRIKELRAEADELEAGLVDGDALWTYIGDLVDKDKAAQAAAAEPIPDAPQP